MNNKKLEKYGLSLLCTEYNPSRGWYNIFPFRLKKDYDFEELKWSLKKNEGIVLARICIGDFKDRELDEKAIGQINDILGFFKKYDREVILRFVYDEDGKGLENEPDSINLVKRHISQIGEAVLAFKSNILTMQGALIGSWGEMHTSRYADIMSVRILMAAMYEAVKGAIPLAVRTPAQHAALDDNTAKITGFFNDALMASQTDFGTFSSDSDKRDEEYRYVDECLKNGVLCGGEAVNDNVYNDGANAQEYLRKLHVTYLNSQYDDKVLNKWKDCGIYEKISRSLGYCVDIESIKTTFTGKINFTIKNIGYASLKQNFCLVISCGDKDFTSDVIRGLEPGQSVNVRFDKKAVTNGGTLFIKRLNDNKRIQIFNEPI